MDTLPSDNPLPPTPTPPPILPTSEPEPTPTLPLAKPHRTSPLVPMFLGVIIVVIISTVLAGFYYFARLKKEVANATPSPSPTLISSPTPSPSPTASSSASPAPSRKPTAKPSSTSTPASTTPTPSPTVTPTPVTTTASLDLRYANPAAHVKQTYDDGSGDGRVINREFSSIQVGEFDEVKSSWTPRVTVCFHVVSNQDLEGNKIGYTLTEDDKIVSEGTLSQYSTLTAGKTYDVCHDTTTALGAHTLRLNINNTKSLGESTFANNQARLDFKNLADNIPPNFTLAGPYNWNEKGTCLLLTYPNDNVTETSALTVEHKIDGADWTSQPKAEYCFKGTSGSSHAYGVRMRDARGNQNEQTATFNLY